MLKKLLYALSLIFILIVLGYRLADEPLPEGQEGPRAEYLADKMLEALNYAAWKEIGAIAWSYPRGHHYIWDKKANLVEVQWDEYKVLLDPDNRTGEIYEDGQLTTKNKQKLLNKAFEFFANDSFWLIAPYKLRDPGTTRKALKYENEEALLVEYKSGGVTPGDAYLWLLDKEGRPYAWKFWVQIVPVGGIKFTWENWVDIEGAKIATTHDGVVDIKITNLRSASSAASLNGGKDPFITIR